MKLSSEQQRHMYNWPRELTVKCAKSLAAPKHKTILKCERATKAQYATVIIYSTKANGQNQTF